MSAQRHLKQYAVCGLAMLFAMPAAATSTILFDDFSSGNDNQWEHVDQTADICDKPATFDASGRDYRLESTCAIDDESNAILAARFVGGPDMSEANGTVRVKARHLNAESNAFISLRSWGTERIGMWGYRYRVSGGGSMLSISRVWEHGTDIVLTARLAASQLFQTGEEIYVEASAVGQRLSLKVWRVGDDEPDQPQLVTSDHVLSAAGDLVIGIDHHGQAARMGATFDDVMFTIAVPGDANGDGVADFEDIMQMLRDWGVCHACLSDANGDGFVDFTDIMTVLANWS